MSLKNMKQNKRKYTFIHQRRTRRSRLNNVTRGREVETVANRCVS
jgi:hypothetical protein